MEKEFVRAYLLKNGKYLPENKLYSLNSNLEHTNVEEYEINILYRNPTLFTLLYWFIPLFWLYDRFFVRDYFGGIVKTILYPFIVFASYKISSGIDLNESYLSAVFIFMFVWFLWIIVDGLTIYSRVKNLNYRKLNKRLGNRNFVTKIGFLPLLMLISSIGLLTYGITNVKSKEKNELTNRIGLIVENEQIEKTEINNETPSSQFYEHSCGESEDDFNGEDKTGYGPLPVYLPNHPKHPDYEKKRQPHENPHSENPTNIVVNDKNTNPFVNSKSYGKGDVSGKGISGETIHNKRGIVSSPVLDDLFIFEKCKVNYRLSVNEKGNVELVDLINYKTFADENQFTRKEKKEREKAKENLLISLENRIKKELVLEVLEKHKYRYYIYEIEFEVSPYSYSTNILPTNR